VTEVPAFDDEYNFFPISNTTEYGFGFTLVAEQRIEKIGIPAALWTDGASHPTRNIRLWEEGSTVTPLFLESVDRLTLEGTVFIKPVVWVLQPGTYRFAVTTYNTDGRDGATAQTIDPRLTDFVRVWFQTSAGLYPSNIATVGENKTYSGMMYLTATEEATITLGTGTLTSKRDVSPLIEMDSDLDLLGTRDLKRVRTINGFTPIGGIFASTASTFTVANTTAVTLVNPTGVGTMAFPANLIKAGDGFRLQLHGKIETDSKSDEVQIKVLVNTTVVHQTDFVDLASISSLQCWSLMLDGTFRGSGAAVDAATASTFSYVKGSAENDMRGFKHCDIVTLDTTVDSVITVTAQWNNPSVNNILTVELMTFNKTF
jgi:hypothetical protein